MFGLLTQRQTTKNKKGVGFIAGNDPYKNLTEPYRRAFKSKYDSTEQPYTNTLATSCEKNCTFGLKP